MGVYNFMKCPVFLFFLAVIMVGNARRTESAPLPFGLIQTVRLKAVAPAKASLTAQGEWPPMLHSSQVYYSIPTHLSGT